MDFPSESLCFAHKVAISDISSVGTFGLPSSIYCPQPICQCPAKTSVLLSVISVVFLGTS